MRPPLFGAPSLPLPVKIGWATTLDSLTPREQESKAKTGTRWKTFHHLEGLDFYPSMRIVGLEFGTNKLEYIDPSCLVSKFRTAVFGSSVTIAQCLNTQLLVPIVNIAL